MLGLGEAGWIQSISLFDGLENVVLFIIALVGSTPIFAWLGRRLAASTNGYGIILYRILDKVILGILLIASIAYIVDATYNPFLYFRF